MKPKRTENGRTSMWSCYSWAHWRCKVLGLSWDMGFGLPRTDSAWETPIQSPWVAPPHPYALIRVCLTSAPFPSCLSPEFLIQQSSGVSHNLSECCCCISLSLPLSSCLCFRHQEVLLVPLSLHSLFFTLIPCYFFPLVQGSGPFPLKVCTWWFDLRIWHLLLFETLIKILF